MGSDTSLAGKVKFIGGAIRKEDFIENELSPIASISREVMEEIGIDLNDKTIVESIDFNYFITRKNLSFINLCFKNKLNLSSNEIVNLFNSYNEYLSNNNFEQELESLVLIENNKDDVNKFFTDNKDCVLEYVEELFIVEIETKEPRDFSNELFNRLQ